MFDFSHHYLRFPDELSGRLDVLFNDTIYDAVDLAIDRSPHEFVPLSDVVAFKREARNPQDAPDVEFMYVDIGSINTVRGEPDAEKMVGRDARSSRMRRVIHRNYVLVSTTRPTRNAICIVPDNLDNQICSTGFAVLETKPEMMPTFLFYSLRSGFCNLQFEKYCSGSGYPAINQEMDLPKIRVPRPDVGLQQQVIDRLIPFETEARELEDQAKLARQQANNTLLSELGLEPPLMPNYFFKGKTEKNSFFFTAYPTELKDRLHFLFYDPKYSYLDELSKKYKTVSLGSVCRKPIHRGEQVKEDEAGIYPWLKTVNLKNQYIDFEGASRVSEQTFAANQKAMALKGDILLTSTGYVSMGKVDIYEADTQSLVDTHISIIRLNEYYDPHFVAYLLRSHLGQLQIERWWTGASGQIELSQTDIAKFSIVSCEDLPYSEQRDIADKITMRLSAAQELELRAKRRRDEASRVFESFVLGQPLLT